MSFDEYRQPHESEIEWGLKKRFLEAHNDKYPERNRLLCMASCFINVELYGCHYPPEVMSELKGCIEEIYDDVQAFRRQVKDRNEVKFVKSSDDAGPQSKSGKDSVTCYPSSNVSNSLRESTVQRAENAGPKKLHYGGFVSASEGTGSTEKETNVVDPLSSSSEGVDKARQEVPFSGVKSFYGGFVSASEPEVTEIKTDNMFNPQLSVNTENDNVSKINPSSSAAHSKAMMSTSDILTGLSDETRNKIFNLGRKLKVLHEKYSATQDNISIISNVVSTRKMTINFDYTRTRGQFICTFTLESAKIATSDAANSKKAAKVDVFNKALQVLTVDLLKLEGLEQEEKKRKKQPVRQRANQNMLNDAVARCHAPGMKRRTSRSDVYCDLYIYEVKDKGTSATGVVQTSADFSKRHLDWQFQSVGNGTRCVVSLEGTVLGDAVDGLKAQAKKAAAEMALKVLRKYCWTILVKQVADSESTVSRDTVLDQPSADESGSALKSGIGGKLLKMMGWSGGGIGKYQQGIAEPISVNKVVKRQGLGMSATEDISPQIKKMVQDFIQSDATGDLEFSSDFSKEERAKIHSICTRFNLKSQSYGSGPDRHLVVSIKRTPSQLFSHIAKQGGETNKYLLLPPSDENEDEDT